MTERNQWIGRNGQKPPVEMQQVTPLQTAPAALVVTGRCKFNGIIIKTNGSDNVTCSVYDSLDGTGRLLLPSDFVVLGTARLAIIDCMPGWEAHNGVYVKITDAVSYMVCYND